jgi:subtilisin-like proprotein convertase family protein
MIRTKHIAYGWLLMAGIVTLALTSSALATTPSTVFVEGYLHTTGGGPVADGSYDVKFALYSAKTGGAAAWSEGPVKLVVKAGQWSYALGTTGAIKAATLASAAKLWIGVQVGSDPELTRLRIHSAFYARVAGGVACTGCIETSAIKAGSLNLTGGTLTADKVVAKSFVGDGSGLTGIKTPSGQCASGKVVSGIDKDGKLICGSASPLPDDGVDQVTQGLIAIVGDLYHGNVPVNLLDNNPKGANSLISLAKVGKIDKLTVTVSLKISAGASGVNALRICLVAPGGALPNNAGFNPTYCTGKSQYLLHDKSGSGNTLIKTWPSPTKEVKGNIAEWIGKDPSGKWYLQVVDTNFDTNGVIGTIEKFTLSARTTGNNKVNVVKELIIDGQSDHNKGIKLGDSPSTCNSANEGLVRFNKATKALQFCDGSEWRGTGAAGAIYRWNVWSTYGQAHGNWYAGNNSSLFGGVNPGTWGDGNGYAYSMSSSTDILKALFWRKGPNIGSGMKNAMVYAHEWYYTSSTNSRHVGVFFRIRNTTAKNINWNACWYRTGYGGWGERASIALNGKKVWESSGNFGPHDKSCHTTTIPANRTSTVIFVNASSSGSGTRSCFLAFYNDCLKLPSGLQYVDDLDSKPNGWDK